MVGPFSRTSLFSPIFISRPSIGMPTDPTVKGLPLWSQDTVAKLSVSPYPANMSMPIACTKISISGEMRAPAVGKILGSVKPSCFLTLLSIVLLSKLYSNRNARGGVLPLLR